MSTQTRLPSLLFQDLPAPKAPAEAAGRVVTADLVEDLIDASWYLARYPDVAAAGVDPKLHYLRSGWKEGRWPNVAFDPTWYRKQSAYLGDHQSNPLIHYLQNRDRDGLQPISWFDPQWYRKTYSVPDNVLSLAHYLQNRINHAVSPSAVFDAAREVIAPLIDVPWYAAQHPDVAQSGYDLADHYRRHGWREGRLPNACFDPEWYASQLPELRNADGDMLAHYRNFGEPHGLRPVIWFDPDWYAAHYRLPPNVSALSHYLAHRHLGFVAPNPEFDVVWYAEQYPDVAGSGMDLFEHYWNHGRHEHRLPRAEIDVVRRSNLVNEQYYIFNYPDFVKSSPDPIEDFHTRGWFSGRRPNPYFEPLWYQETYQPPASLSPLAHYILAGERAGHRPSLYFDPAWYRETYAVPDFESPLAHYLRHRHEQCFSPLPVFDVDYYMRCNGHEVRKGRDPFLHYLVSGAPRDLNPAPWFDAATYRLNRMAVDSDQSGLSVEIRANPLLHFLATIISTFGRSGSSQC